MKRFVILASAVCAFVFTAHAQDEVPHFKEPAPIIKELAMSSPVPSKFYNPQYSKAVLASRKCRAVPLAELAGPEERIGGERFNPVNFSASRVIPFESIEMHSLGPNSAVQFTSVVYLCLFEMMIYTCKAKVRKSIILYMAEVDEAAMSETKITGKKIVKLVIGVILLLVIAGVYLWENIPHYII